MTTTQTPEGTHQITPRLKNPAALLPEVMAPIQALVAAAQQGGVPESTLQLVHLRASQINGCSVCVVLDFQQASRAGGVDAKLFAVSAWREAPYFTDAERAALALSEAVTRLADRPDPVPDDVWNAAAAHFDERGLSALLLMISLANLFNRFNVATRQPAGAQNW